MHNHGRPIRGIARRLGLHRTTVRKYIGAGEFLDIAQRRRMPTKFDPYLAYLKEPWQAGSGNRLHFWREIREQGFDGAHQLLYGWTQKKGFRKKGSVNRLKLIKRQMYGRANFDLLRRRVLRLPSDPKQYSRFDRNCSMLQAHKECWGHYTDLPQMSQKAHRASWVK